MKIPVIFLLIPLIIAASGCIDTKEEEHAVTESGSTEESVSVSEDDTSRLNEGSVDPEVEPGYLAFFQGLHVTGTPVDIDISEYRLTITGKVRKPLEITFSEVKEMPGKQITTDLVCPGFFVDTGTWTGVEVRDLLEKAGVRKNAGTVQFISYDGSYGQQATLEQVLDETYLVAYYFEGKEFHKVHGYPLRIAAPEESGSVWVKWLGEIHVE